MMRPLVDEELKALTPSFPLALGAQGGASEEGAAPESDASASLDGALIDQLSEGSPTPRPLMLPELRLRPSLFSVITRPAPFSEESPSAGDDVAAGSAEPAASSEQEQEQEEAAPAAETASSKEEEKEEEGEPTAAPAEEAASCVEDEESDEKAAQADSATETTDAPPVKRRSVRVELETPKTPMTSVAVKPFEKKASKQGGERRWMGALAILGGIVVVSAGSRAFSKKESTAAAAQPPSIALEPTKTTEAVEAVVAPVVTDTNSPHAATPVVSDVSVKPSLEPKGSLPARAPTIKSAARDAGASLSTSTSSPASVSGLDVAAAAAVEFQSPRGLHRLP